MSKDYYKRKQQKKDDQQGDKTSGTDITANLFNALQYHPTNAMPTTPEVGAKLWPIEDVNYQDATPGVMIAKFMPVLGSNSAMSLNSTLTNVPKNIWSSLRNYCTTAVNYQPGDVLNALTQLGTFPMLFARVKRMMKSVYQTDTSRNLYTRQLYFALNRGSSTENHRRTDISQMNDYVARYNSAVQLFNSIAVPDMFPIFHRWEYLCSEIFVDVEIDGDDSKNCAQYICFDTDNYYITTLADPSTPGADMTPYALRNTINGCLNDIEEFLQSIWDDTSLRYILGDLRQTYGSDNLYTVDAMTIDEVMNWKPKYSFEVLYALYNATVLPIVWPTLHVDPESGNLEGVYLLPDNQTELSLNKMKEFVKTRKIFNAQKWGVTLEEFCKFTQWTIMQSIYTPDRGLLSPGPELIVGLLIYGFDFSPSTHQAVLRSIELNENYYTTTEGFTYTAAQQIREAGEACALRAFAWAPITYYFMVTAVGSEVSTWRVAGINAELELPVVLDYTNITAWHDAIRESLWGLPKQIEFKTRGSK